MKISLVSIILLLAISTNAYAFFTRGNDLVGDMGAWKSFTNGSPNADHLGTSAYINYVKGIYDAYSLNDVICHDSRHVTVNQVTAVVAKYLDNNPERWSEPAFYLVADAPKLAFPCPA